MIVDKLTQAKSEELEGKTIFPALDTNVNDPEEETSNLIVCDSSWEKAPIIQDLLLKN